MTLLKLLVRKVGVGDMKFPLTFFIAFLAYTPLWFVVAVKAAVSLITNKCGYISVESFGLVFVLVLEVFGILCVWTASKKDFSEKAKANPPNKYKMLSCQEQKTVTIRFIVENILPVLAFDSTTVEGLASILVYFFVIASITVKHKHFPANIIVEWLGWTFYECSICSLADDSKLAKTVVVVSLKRLGGTNQILNLKRINDETFIVIKEMEK